MRARALALPIPLLAPVTTATFCVPVMMGLPGPNSSPWSRVSQCSMNEMAALTEHVSYADAHRLCSPARLWELFDGDRQRLNIAHECIDRHPADRVAVRLAHADGRDEAFTFGHLAAWSARFAHYLADRAIGPGDRVGIMLEPSLPFYAGLFGA